MIHLIIKGKKDGNFEELYPKTLADNVVLDNGKSLQELAYEMEELQPSNILLWEGASYPDAGQTIKPSKPLKDCLNGWELRFQRYVKGDGEKHSQYQYEYIRKTHALYADGGGVRFTLSYQGGLVLQKFMYIHNDKIEGHDYNKEDDNHNLALTGIFEW